MTHKTKGIVLRTINYGETSVITSVYTELFGLQSYIVKGVRQSTKKKQAGQMYFQPSAILEMEVYYNQLKNLQFVKEYRWGYLYEKVLFNIARTAVAQFIIELFQHAIKQPEANPELFYLLEGSLMQADKGSDTIAANLPLYFILHLATELGFQLQGIYSEETSSLDLKGGAFVTTMQAGFVSGFTAATISKMQHIQFYNDLENIKLTRLARREILEVLLQYISFHLTDHRQLKSLSVLQEVLD